MLDENGVEVPDINKEPESGGDKNNNRFKDLADKVKTTAEERDAANAAKEAAEKELNFYKDFSKISSKPEFQAAPEFQEKIKEKVLAGNNLEDATFAVLGKAGKLGNAAPVQRESPAGGSATTTMNQGGEKTIAEMTRAEKREALMQGEAESGSLTKILRRGL